MDNDLDSLPDIDSLFEERDQDHSPDSINILFLGTKKNFNKLEPILKEYGKTSFQFTDSIDEAIDYLLRDIYAVIFLDDNSDIDIVTVSRIVRVNHPLARIVVLSESKRSLYIADIINHGSADAYLNLPFKKSEVSNILTTQLAKHEIDKMLTSFVSQPPNLTAASYLLLDPTLTAGEDEPVKFVGIMISAKSVPRYSKFFEELLAKDEILFSGYLSGITILGQELVSSKQPLKEIHFGGISVIFRFHEELQFSVFVRNLSKHNVKMAESIISSVVDELIKEAGDILDSYESITGKIEENIEVILSKFEEANAEVQYRKELERTRSTKKGQTALFYGIDKNEHRKVKKYFKRKVDYQVKTATTEEEVNQILETYNCSVLVIESQINETDEQSVLDYSEFVKDEYPYLQIIYRVRDRRASKPIINSLNSGAIDYLISYSSTRKELKKWLTKAIEKAMEFRTQADTKDSLATSLNKAVIAKTMIRKDSESYLVENAPLLNGIFITKNENPIFQRFWNVDTDVRFDDLMLAGLVASLDSVGEEMFHDTPSIGELELGDANIMVEHREDYNFAFFIKNLNPQLAHIISNYLQKYTDKMYKIIQDNPKDLQEEYMTARFDTVSNTILSDFMEKFTEN